MGREWFLKEKGTAGKFRRKGHTFSGKAAHDNDPYVGRLAQNVECEVSTKAIRQTEVGNHQLYMFGMLLPENACLGEIEGKNAPITSSF